MTAKKAEALARQQAEAMEQAAKGCAPMDKLTDAIRGAAEMAGLGGAMPSLRGYLEAFPRTASAGSEINRRSRGYYAAFLNTEEDDNDRNYFIIDQLNTIYASIESLMKHLRAKQQLNEQLHVSQDCAPYINHRQRHVLLHFLQHPHAYTSVSLHCNEFNVVLQTARTDLTGVEKLGFLYTELVSREFIFRPTPNLEQRIHGFINRQSADKG